MSALAPPSIRHCTPDTSQRACALRSRARQLLILRARQTARTASQANAGGATQLTFRRGTPADARTIQWMTFKESMNPLGLKPERFVIAVDNSNDAGNMLGFGQLEPHGDAESSSFLEMRTLIVDPAYRGRGIGTALVQYLLESAQGQDVYLTTLQRSIPFYSPHGFKELPLNQQSIPQCAPACQSSCRALWFEVAAGLAVARIVAKQRLVCLRRKAV